MEDFQVAKEVFVTNEYTVRSPRRRIVVDIGKNVGLASLLMAHDPNVIAVHSFEPFEMPFKRALENFSINPLLAPKIHANHFGLAGENLETDVFVNDSATISTSIKGVKSGRSETIRVREAAIALASVFEEAADIGADVFLKIDCEGSEFAIFESLARHDRFKSVRGIMVEWHKWWSADKTQMDLMKFLFANDFIVFDRTNGTDLWAGQFNALRVTRD